MTRRLWLTILASVVMIAIAVLATSFLRPRHNIIIFVADGLRYDAVNPVDAPEMSRVRAQGVDFADSHSLFPTVTTANASAIATGHALGDTGDYANSVYLGPKPLKTAFLSLLPFYEDDGVIGEANARFGGNYLNEVSLLHVLNRAGWSTAALGKQGPVWVQDVLAGVGGDSTLIIDDRSGDVGGVPVPKETVAAIKAAGLDWPTPDRGLNDGSGSAIMAGTLSANVEQQDWFAKVATEVVLPRFAAKKRPFAMVFWSRDPDGTQHNQGDSLNTLTPGINGPTVKAAVRNADADLARLRTALVKLGIDKTTDIVVTADHGFSTITKQSATSDAAKATYPDVPAGFLPPGFLGMDLGKALDLPVWEPNGLAFTVPGHPRSGNAILGRDPSHPDILIGANGGAELFWFPTVVDKRAMAQRIIAALSPQDYVAAFFTADAMGDVPGALPLSVLRFKGSARTPPPDMMLSLRSAVIPGCARPLLCAAEVTDGSLQQGQGSHGALNRANTRNMMAAIGPDFRQGYVDPAPVSNADWVPTLAKAVGLRLPSRGSLTGRVMEEALRSGPPAPRARAERLSSKPGPNGFVSAVDVQRLDGRIYVDAASRSVRFKP